MESLQENNAPYIAYGKFHAEKEVTPKLPLDSKMQKNVQTKNPKYSESKTVFNVSQDEILQNGISEQKLSSECTHNVNGDLEKEMLIHKNTDEVFLQNNLNLTIKSEESGVSDLDSSTGVGKASSGYCTDTSEKEEITTDENIAHKVTTPSCSESSPPASSSAANDVEAAESSANVTSRTTRSRSYSLRSRPKRSSIEVVPGPQQNQLLVHKEDPQHDSLPFHKDDPQQDQSSFHKDDSQQDQSSFHKDDPQQDQSSFHKDDPQQDQSSFHKDDSQQDQLLFHEKDPQEDLLPFDIEKLLHCNYKPVTSEEIYLKKLIQQLDSSYTKAVVLVTRLEDTDPSLWRKYLSK